MPKVVAPVDPTQPIEINISGMTAHVFAYRLWWRDGASPGWTVVGDGSTGDQQSDSFQHAFAAGAQLSYWIGVGGEPNTAYHAIVSLGQGGALLPSGLTNISGTTNDKGVSAVEDWVNFA